MRQSVNSRVGTELCGDWVPEELDEMFVKRVSARKFKTYQTEAERAGQIVFEQLRRESM